MVEMRDDVDGMAAEIHVVRRKRRVALICLRSSCVGAGISAEKQFNAIKVKIF